MELHTYYSKLGLLKLTWGSAIDSESIRRHFELLRYNTSYDRNLKIVTSSEVDELRFPLTQENMLLFRKWREEALREYESVTTAFYNLKPVPAAYINYFSEFFDTGNSCMQQFDTEEHALRWLFRGEYPSEFSKSVDKHEG